MLTGKLRARIRRATIAFTLLYAGAAGFAQTAPNRYAVILEDPPVSSRFASQSAIRSAAAGNYRQQIEAAQRKLRSELATKNFHVTGSTSTLLNAVFVLARPDRVAELRSLPGVKAVVPLRRYRVKMNRAAQLVNAPAAWNMLGGAENGGSGIKIAILDSGIDQAHPAFQDSSLQMPSGYPHCSGSDCAFTNNKVIVARSYVSMLAAGSSPANPAADSRPDDYSPRDRDGHGTAVASCAGGVSNTGAVTFSGIAPKAYLGNYKIYGSPEVNDFTADDVIIQALDDAINDGMDIVSFSSGAPAFSAPLDSGAACGNPPGVPCDLSAAAFENAARAGMIIVAAAGNDGGSGQSYPAFTAIESPGDAPSVIAAGATTNSHFFVEAVTAKGLPAISAQSGDAYVPIGAVSGPLRDTTTVGDVLACTALPGGSLTGTIALVERGTCSFQNKVANAQAAGALGVILYMADASAPIPPGGLSSFNIPAVMIAQSDAQALKSFAAANPNQPVAIDPNGIEQDAASFNQLARFSSLGPSTGDYLVKPDLVAVGTSVYMAAESFDPLGILYSATGYAAADGTSFATPITSGAAALVKQSHPRFTSAQVKSALVNTASQDVTTDDSGNPVDVRWIGAGKVDAGAAVAATVTSDPATVSFGVLKAGSLPATRQIQITNSASSPVTLAVSAASAGAGAAPALDRQSLTLPAGGAGTVTATLSGSVPQPGSYSGVITIQGGGALLRVPYLYLVGSGIAANIVPLSGASFDGTVNGGIPDGIVSFKLTDAFGVPIANAPVTFQASNGATLVNADSTTDSNGIAAARPVLGPTPGRYSFSAVAGGMRTVFSGSARRQPAISAGGVVEGASFAKGSVAPGSYVSIFGTALSDTTDAATSSALPLAIDYVNVSFDVPSANLSLPGHLVYVSPGQVNVQVPWELQGQSAAQVKVTIDYSNGNVVSVPIANYAPAFFEIAPGAVAALDLNYKVIGSNNPARRGQVVQLYANGLGPVNNQPESGTPAPASPLATATTTPVVTIGSQNAAVGFSGLAPGFAGLYQINTTVPASLAPGNYPITVSIGGHTSPASGIVVQ